MRRFVKDRIANALEQGKPSLEEYIAQHLRYPEGFPYNFALAAVLIRDVRQLKLAALAKAELPPVRVEAVLKVWLANRAARIRGDWDPGVLDADVQLTTHGTVAPDGSYNVEPRSAVLKAWWRDMVLVESQRLYPR